MPPIRNDKTKALPIVVETTVGLQSKESLCRHLLHASTYHHLHSHHPFLHKLRDRAIVEMSTSRTAAGVIKDTPEDSEERIREVPNPILTFPKLTSDRILLSK